MVLEQILAFFKPPSPSKRKLYQRTALRENSVGFFRQNMNYGGKPLLFGGGGRRGVQSHSEMFIFSGI